MHSPAKTLYIIIGDLFDTSPNPSRFVEGDGVPLLESGVHAVTLLAISDQGQPRYNEDLAGKLIKLGMPCFGCTPDHLPADLLAAVLRGGNDTPNLPRKVQLIRGKE